MNVSPDFSLPIRVIAPYFIGGSFFYTLAMVSLLGIDPQSTIEDYRVIGWVHLYMIGFVMMAIIGAMGQMSVVVGEVHHRFPKVFEWIAASLSAGTILLVSGLYTNPLWMVLGGLILFGGLGLFAFNLFFTLRESRRRTTIIRSMQWSTFFLMIGIIIGIVMASGYTGIIFVEPAAFREFHIFALIGGYVMVNIMGVSTVVLPMFGGCNRPSDNDYSVSFFLMGNAVLLMFGSAWFWWLGWAAFALAIVSIIYYMIKIYRIFASKKRDYTDIWERSVAVAFLFLLASIITVVYGYIREDEKALMIGFWFFSAGFLGFLISAHLYKIVPFLIWFEKFAPYIEDKVIPMMHELLPQNWAKLQWQTALLGTMSVGLSILIENPFCFIGGTLLMVASGIILSTIIVTIVRFKGVDE